MGSICGRHTAKIDPLADLCIFARPPSGHYHWLPEKGFKQRKPKAGGSLESQPAWMLRQLVTLAYWHTVTQLTSLLGGCIICKYLNWPTRDMIFTPSKSLCTLSDYGPLRSKSHGTSSTSQPRASYFEHIGIGWYSTPERQSESDKTGGPGIHFKRWSRTCNALCETIGPCCRRRKCVRHIICTGKQKPRGHRVLTGRLTVLAAGLAWFRRHMEFVAPLVKLR